MTNHRLITNYANIIMQRDKVFKHGDQTYRNLRNRVQRMIRSAKTLHLKQSEPGKWHQQIRHLSGQQKAIPMPS